MSIWENHAQPPREEMSEAAFIAVVISLGAASVGLLAAALFWVG